jgi:hypothetical protein
LSVSVIYCITSLLAGHLLLPVKSLCTKPSILDFDRNTTMSLSILLTTNFCLDENLENYRNGHAKLGGTRGSSCLLINSSAFSFLSSTFALLSPPSPQLVSLHFIEISFLSVQSVQKFETSCLIYLPCFLQKQRSCRLITFSDYSPCKSRFRIESCDILNQL